MTIVAIFSRAKAAHGKSQFVRPPDRAGQRIATIFGIVADHYAWVGFGGVIGSGNYICLRQRRHPKTG